MKKNTIEQLNQFKKNQNISVYDFITGELEYSGKILFIAKNAYLKYGTPARASVILDTKGNKHINLLSYAK